MAASREELQPLWGAWLPSLLAGVMGTVLLGLFVSWFGLAFAYVMPVWLLGFYLNRRLSMSASWKLSGAALLPGALVMLAGISFYDLGALDLVGLLFVFVAHIVTGWVYLVLGVVTAERVVTAAGVRKNPFRSAGEE